MGLVEYPLHARRATGCKILATYDNTPSDLGLNYMICAEAAQKYPYQLWNAAYNRRYTLTMKLEDFIYNSAPVLRDIYIEDSDAYIREV